MNSQVEKQTANDVVRSRWVMVNGVHTHYSEAGGDGPVVICNHGGGAGSSGSAGMGGLLPELAKQGFRAIAIDAVGGFGRTDVAAPVPYGVQSRVEHLEDFVATLGLDRFTMCGNSQGAWVAAKYAIVHPDKVDALVIIGSATIASAMGIPEEFTEAFTALANYDYTRPGMKKMLEALVHNPEKISDALIDERFESSIRPGAKEALAAFSAGHRYLQSDVMRWNFDMRASLPTLTKHIPTASVWGANDRMAPAHLGQKLQSLLPDAQWFFVDDAGHQVQTDHPERLAQIAFDVHQKAARA